MQLIIAYIAYRQMVQRNDFHRNADIRPKNPRCTSRHGISVAVSVMETIAITDWNAVVSPLYDAACRFRIVRPDGAQKVINVKNSSLIEKADLCRSEGVAVIICGAISAIARKLLEERKITVLSWIGGPVDKVLDAYRSNINIKERFSMPECRPRKYSGERTGRCHRRGHSIPHTGRQGRGRSTKGC
jgi:predicted Fe-Mo cluster-binding NifX family protein